MNINLTVVQIGNTEASQAAAVTAAVTSGDFDFYFGPFSSVRRPVITRKKFLGHLSSVNGPTPSYLLPPFLTLSEK